MPGIRISAGPEPFSMMCTVSVPQRLARLQSVLNPLQCLSLPAELQKRLTLEVEDVVLTDGGCLRQRTAGENERQCATHNRVVFADAAGPPGEMNAELECGVCALAANRQQARHRTLIPLAHAFERQCFRIGDQPVAIH